MSTKIKTALEKLKVASGGKGSCQRVSRDLNLCLFEERGADYRLTATFRGREIAVAVPRASVVTKGKSMWRRDNLWRLTPAAVSTFTSNLREVLQKTARKTAHQRWEDGRWVSTKARR